MIRYRTCCLLSSLFVLMLVLPLAAQQRWESASNGLDGGSVRAFGFSADGNVYAGSLDGIYRLVDGNRWEMLHRSLRAYRFLTGPDGTMIMSGLSTAHGIQALYRSTDNGRSWQISFDTVQVQPHMAPDGTLYFLDHTGLFRSGDMGKSWDLLVTPEAIPKRQYGPGLLVLEESGALIFSPRDSMIYVSTDKGSSWNKTATIPTESITHLEILPDGRLGIMLGGSPDIYVSSDRGRSIQVEDSVMLGPRLELPNGNHVFYNRRNDSRGLFRSLDSGRSWSRIDRELLQAFDVAPDGTLWRSIVPRVYRSMDEGKSWEEVTTGMDFIGATLPVVDNEGNLYTARFDKILNISDPTDPDGSWAIFRSSDKGSSWQKVTDSMDYNIRTDGSGRLYGNRILPEDQVDGDRLYRTPVVSHDGGQSWRRLYSGATNNGFPFFWEVYRDGVVLARVHSASDGEYRLVISLDGGSTWRRIAHPLGVGEVHRTEGGTMVGYLGGNVQDSNRGIYRSLDNGTTWELVIRGVGMDNISFSSDRQGTIYIAANPGFGTSRIQAVYRSLDNGATFQIALDSAVNFAAFRPTAHGTMFLVGYASSNHPRSILKTDDRGATWSAVSLPPGYEMQLLVPVSGKDGAIYSSGSYYMGSDTALLYRSLDDGQSWHTFNEGRPTGSAMGLLDMPNGPLFVVSARGIYRTTTPSVVPVAATEEALSFDVVPNPADDHASITVTLESPQHLRVTLHDMLGRTLGVLADGEHGAGRTTLPITTELAAGSYIVRVSVGKNISSRVVFFR